MELHIERDFLHFPNILQSHFLHGLAHLLDEVVVVGKDLHHGLFASGIFLTPKGLLSLFFLLGLVEETVVDFTDGVTHTIQSFVPSFASGRDDRGDLFVRHCGAHGGAFGQDVLRV